jgi:flagellar basal body-associated protein FliL
MDEESKQKRSNILLALALAAVAVAVMAAFIWSVASSGGAK